MKDYSIMTEDLIKEMITILEEAYDYGYDQGYADAKSEKGQNIIDLAHKEIDRAYQRGLNEAWEVAKKITEIPITKRAFVFDLSPETDSSFFSLLKMLSVQEAIAKIKAYEKQQKQDAEIKVGDEVVLNCNASYENEKAIILACDESSYPYNVLMSNGDTEWVKEDAIERKTGRHFDQIAEVLTEVGGEG